jgi:hypothetical protein
MRKTLIIAVLALTLILAGCLAKAEKWGCCIRANATDLHGGVAQNKCFLYNTTDFKNYTSLMGLPTQCNESVLNCVVQLTADRNVTLPICTGSELVNCVSPDCTAMVCGSFAFKPRAAPGYSDMNDTSTPALDQEGDAVNFYKAQCRFLPMDAKLNNIMKNSKSQINVFRLGVGGSFDEYDQYRNFLPMSDRFCNINPSGDASSKIDRFMNYLGGDNAGGVAPYDDPVSGLVDNCVDDANPPPPFKFGEASAGVTNTIVPGVLLSPTISWSRKIPDVSNYKTAHQFRWDLAAVWVTDNGGFFAYNDFNAGDIPPQADRMYKKIDDAFYRKYLSIAHADDIYDTAHTGKSRAPFECDISTNECYSGSCDTSLYMRGTLVESTDGNDKREIVADCVKDLDENAVTKVICNPTTAISLNGASTPPTITPAYVKLVPALLVGDYDPLFNSINPSVSYDQLNDQNNNMFDSAYTSFPVNEMANAWLANAASGEGWAGRVTGTSRTMQYGADDINFYWSQKKYCSIDYPGAAGTSSENDTVWCSSLNWATSAPPIGGAVFFGKTGNDQVKWGGTEIIGYALARPEDFPNLYVVKNCQMTANDYVKVDIGTPNTWGPLMTAFKPYYDNHMKELMGKGWQDDGCGGSVDLMDGVFTASPWIVNFEKGVRQIRDVPVYGPSDYATALSVEKALVFHLSSQPAQHARARNNFDTPMRTLSGSSSCELRRTWTMNQWSNLGKGFFENRMWQGYYNILYASNIYLFKYDPATKKLGNCAIDENSYMPKVTTLGWCKPCTTSTLAFQRITTQRRVYLPMFTADVEGATAKNMETLCTPNYNTEWGWEGMLLTPVTSDNVSCFNTHVTDLQEYKESIGWFGSPKTIPEATIIKERAGNYLKSGVMPVYDLSDVSNWNRDNPDCVPSGDGCEGKSILWWSTNLFGPQRYFLQYDFQRLFANMGASVVVVDHVRDTDDVTALRTYTIWGFTFTGMPSIIDEVRARAEIVRDFCPYCLVAVHVDNPTTPDSFSRIINDTVVDPSVSVDMFTFDYDISRHNYQIQKPGIANASLVPPGTEGLDWGPRREAGPRWCWASMSRATTGTGTMAITSSSSTP